MGKKLTQNIAVFGESGSGKTVLLSSFYGGLQEPDRVKRNHFYVTADNASQGNILQSNFLGMKKSSRLPAATRFDSATYSFTLSSTTTPNKQTKSSRKQSGLGLRWHDYPGEWFEQEVSGATEAKTRVDTFRNLLVCDVALVLVDSQKLIDNKGREERYLKTLLTNFRNGLLSLRDEILEGGKPLVEFPRIWMFVLSKSDLLPEMNVQNFRDLLIEKVAQEIVDFRNVVSQFVDSPDALAVGEDFLLLSSAKFEAKKIEVEKRVGVDLILPISSVFPFERHLRWSEAKNVSRKVVLSFVMGAGAIATAVAGKKFLKLPKAGLVALAATAAFELMKGITKLAGSELEKAHAEALAKQDFLASTLIQFKIDLDESEKHQVLLRSLR